MQLSREQIDHTLTRNLMTRLQLLEVGEERAATLEETRELLDLVRNTLTALDVKISECEELKSKLETIAS